MSKLMILGGSNCQKNALAAARRLGHQTVLIDYFEDPPAAALADIHCRESTFDVNACLQAARLHDVDGVFTIGTDQPVLTAATVSRHLRLPTLIDPETALAVTNKRVMKPLLTAHGIPTVKYTFLSRQSGLQSLMELHPPYVLKPVDSQGQRGIFKLSSQQEVFEHLDETLSFSRQAEALIEEFYPSDEITFSGWVQEGHLYPLAVTDRLLYDDPVHIGVCTGHRFPSVHLDCYHEILKIAQDTIAAFGICGGPVYIQMLIGAEGIKVNELACRIGGAFEDVFIPWLSGFDILKAVIYGALGQPTDVSMLKSYDLSLLKKQISVELMFARPGKLAHMTPLETLRALPFVLDAGYNYGIGQTIGPVENATARLGHCVLVSENDRIGEHVRAFYETFQVLSEQGENLVIPCL